MNTYLLQFVGKWMSMLLISILSLFIKDFQINETEIINDIQTRNTSVESTIIPYKTNYVYNSKLPWNTTNVLKEGIDGIVYLLENQELLVQEMVPEVVEIGTGPQAEYVGMLTGYGPDCVGCSKVGNVACMTRENNKHSLINDGIYYNDIEYGQVRIISADHRLFPCGTIMEIQNNNFEKTLAIVLDTGSGMRNAYEKGRILIDLAFATESQTSGVTNRNTNFTVKRYGW